ncbi:metallophosphoesterase family protein [Sphingomonas sp. M1-B02]|uniref:metallophosphoesterase family protein n=1 Tax=Sphingomonas sp. M1-B02 TaxID=3114300 RepID=UPI00223F5B53|nr:metallophosphoesterase family protein [Sphingomonas sp. S6-11]UZK66239.1 serine/threonine protein phosphatase [Sphingomonas sp. S6-11]
MIFKLFSKRVVTGEPVAAVPDGKRVYAIGDIHGRLDLLEALLSKIHEDDRRRGSLDTQLILLGDLVDRGPHSAQVIDRVLQLKAEYPATRILLGNHEEIFSLALAGDLKALKLFTRIGGRETILSYGISEETYHEAGFPELLTMIQAAVPREHVEFLDALEDLIIIGGYAFVHAGIRPDEPLDRQRVADLRWIRDEFLLHRGALEKVVVHGHTIAEDVELLSHRIGLDTGAYSSGVLSAMGFEGHERWVLQAKI